MAKETVIRPCTGADEAAWLQMRRSLWPECSAERHAVEMGQLGKSREAIVLLAVDDTGGSCGFSEVSIRHDHVDGAANVPTAYLEGWYVVPRHRGTGLGSRLLAAAEKWALERGLHELASDAELENAPSIEAHLACGFKETCRAVHFIKKLPADK